MKQLHKMAKILSAALVLVLLFALASCAGSLKLESFTVDRSSVKTVYFVGEEIDFSGIKATAKYSDKDLNKEYTAAELTVTYAEDITATPGTKYVKVSFMDPNLDVEQSTDVQITVKADPNSGETSDVKGIVSGFEKNAALKAFESDKNGAGKTAYGETGFQGEYLTSVDLYVIGDDNEFRFVPDCTVIDEDFNVSTLSAFYADIEIYVDTEEGYVKLDKAAIDGTVNYVYTLNGETIVTVDTYQGAYQFKAPVDKVKISVLPSSEYYAVEDIQPVVLEARVVDGYNVYTANDLCVIDNTGREEWEDFKLANGYTGIAPSGIILHRDIHISKTSVPASFFYTSEKEVKYYNPVSDTIHTAPAGTSYLKDWTFVYEHAGTDNFFISGNYFTIDTKSFPVIATPNVFGADADKDYGTDYSNAALFKFASVAEKDSGSWVTAPETAPEITVENIQIIGNAGRDNWVEYLGESGGSVITGSLVTAGGLIMVKGSRHAVSTFNNVLSNSFYLTYFGEYDGHLVVNNAKCYDSYQDAAFIWDRSTITVNDSYLIGSGGPVIMAQSIDVGGGVYYNPVVTVNNTIVETNLIGTEVWFVSTGAANMIDDIKALGGGVNQFLGTVGQMIGAPLSGDIVNADGKMNLIATLMPNVSSAEDLTDAMIQGTISVDGVGVDRWYAGENASEYWTSILTHPAFAQGASFLTAYGADGVAYTIYYNGETFCDAATNAPLTECANVANIATAFATADKIMLHLGGLSAIFELYH